MTFKSTKTFGHNLGISCAFRQWKAQSHCKFIHGYALSFKFTFECDELDDKNWCVDFGGLKGLKSLLESSFDHKLLVASDDPELQTFMEKLHERGIANIVVMPNGVGCEKFAEYAYGLASDWLEVAGYSPRVRLVSVEVAEHGANSAIYQETK